MPKLWGPFRRVHVHEQLPLDKSVSQSPHLSTLESSQNPTPPDQSVREELDLLLLALGDIRDCGRSGLLLSSLHCRGPASTLLPQIKAQLSPTMKGLLSSNTKTLNYLPPLPKRPPSLSLFIHSSPFSCMYACLHQVM